CVQYIPSLIGNGLGVIAEDPGNFSNRLNQTGICWDMGYSQNFWPVLFQFFPEVLQFHSTNRRIVNMNYLNAQSFLQGKKLYLIGYEIVLIRKNYISLLKRNRG